MEVREATVDDCEAIGRGMAEVVVEGEGRWLATESASADALAERFRDSIEAEDHRVFVLTDGEEIVGALGMHPTRTAGVLSLGMWIRRPWRRRGGGRRLIEAAIAARPAGVHKIELEWRSTARSRRSRARPWSSGSCSWFARPVCPPPR